jgi:hypothetical protein
MRKRLWKSIPPMPSHLRLSLAYRFMGKYDLWFEEWEKAAKFSNDADDLARVAAPGARTLNSVIAAP